MNKGMTNNLLSAIVAVIALVGLVFLGVRLYDTFVSQEDKNAQAFIDGLSAKIEALDVGENNTFALRGVENWILVGFNFKDTNRPDKCFLGNCICVCKDSISNCADQGFCRSVDKNVTVNSTLDYRRYTSGSSTGTGYDVLSRGYASCVVMQKNIAPYYVSIKQKDVYISSSYSFNPPKEDEQRKNYADLIKKVCDFKEGELLEKVEDGRLAAYPYQGGGSPI